MKILAHACTMVPTDDLAVAVSAHVASGLNVYWRPDPRTALLGVNDRACVMVEDDPAERALGPGPVLLVDAVTRLGLDDAASWAISPTEVPVGNYAASNRGRTVLRYLDLTKLEDKIPRAWFGETLDERRA
ncbi:hypothetical protein [Brevibacterium permense]|uniref:Uncharacterized protein n=1 Tax=Brevibacterium permense TaxID=234834 RepID=A0ABN2A6Q6_9MICO|nr:hypothetical protein [Brevibacterium permense]